jgi:glycogen(starch) synthase
MRDRRASSDVSPCKILMTTDAVGGVWQYSLDLISHLVQRGAQVLLATLGPRPADAQKARVAQMQDVTLHESEYKLEWMHEPWTDMEASGEWLLALAEQFRPDIVHLNGYTHARLRWPAPVLVVGHSCVYSWWHAVHGGAPPAEEWAEYQARVSAGLHSADRVVAPSASMARALGVHYGMNGANVRVIYNFSEARPYGGREKERFFLAAGRTWDIGKNLEMLNSIRDRLPWPMHIEGGLPHEAVIGEMQRACIYVHPALYEPFGLAILEAARAWCCLVLSDIPSLRELWDGAAVFVHPRDPEAWTQVLNDLARDAKRRESLCQAARTHAKRYSPETAIEQYWNVYKSLLQSRRQEGTAA